MNEKYHCYVLQKLKEPIQKWPDLKETWIFHQDSAMESRNCLQLPLTDRTSYLVTFGYFPGWKKELKMQAI